MKKTNGYGRKIFLVFLMTFLLTGCGKEAQKDEDFSETEEVTATAEESTEEEIQTPLIELTVPIRETSYRTDGSVFEETEYSYDENGMLTSESHFVDGGFRGWTEYKYDEHGNKTEAVSGQSDDDPVSRLVYDYQYDELGRVLRVEKSSGDDGTMYEFYEYDYDENGNVTEERLGDSAGVVYTWIFYEYDENGRLVNESQSLSNWTTTYRYDADGKLIEKNTHSYEGDEEHSREEWEYDENGNPLKVKYYSFGEFQLMKEYKYTTILVPEQPAADKETDCDAEDLSGNDALSAEEDKEVLDPREKKLSVLTRITTYERNGSISDRQEYEYDAVGNLVKEIHGNIYIAYTYNEKGLLSGRMEYETYEDGSQNLTYGMDYVYDEDGRLSVKVDHIGHLSDPPYYEDAQTTYVYDRSGNLSEETCNRSGSDYTVQYLYDEKNNLREEDWIFGDGSGIDRITYVYDEKNQLLEKSVKHWYGDGQTDKYEYSKSGKVVREETYSYNDRQDDIRNITTYQYDEQDRLVQESHISSRDDYESEIRITYQYDDMGRLIQESHMSLNDEYDSETNITYQYDESGNKINSVSTELGISELHEWIYDENGQLLKDILYWEGDFGNPDFDPRGAFKEVREYKVIY